MLCMTIMICMLWCTFSSYKKSTPYAHIRTCVRNDIAIKQASRATMLSLSSCSKSSMPC